MSHAKDSRAFFECDVFDSSLSVTTNFSGFDIDTSSVSSVGSDVDVDGSVSSGSDVNASNNTSTNSGSVSSAASRENDSLSETSASSVAGTSSAEKKENAQKQTSKSISTTNSKKSTVKVKKVSSTQKFDYLPQYARNYLFSLINVDNLSPKTVYEYYLDLRTFFRFVMQMKNLTNEDNFDEIDADSCPASIIEKLTLTELYEFLNFVREDRDNDVSARMRKTSSLRSFYKYLCKQAVIDENPTLYLESPKQPKRLPVYLTIDDSLKLLESIDGAYKERNFAILTLFLNCGLRLSELVGINLSNISGNQLRVIGKGNKERIVYLNQACVDALAEYLKVRPTELPDSAKNAMFISRDNRRISRRMVQTIVEKFIKISGLDPELYSTHKLRHTAATLMYQNGVDVRVLQQILGHSNLGTTQIYTHIADRQIEHALDSNPLNRKIEHKKTDETE